MTTKDNLDWDEGPVECCNSWEAAAASEGFNTLCLRRLQVMPVQRDEETPAGFHQMKLLEGQGWGDGEHPSTWLCLDFLEMMIRGECSRQQSGGKARIRAADRDWLAVVQELSLF